MGSAMGLKVLIADDEPINLGLLVEYFQMFGFPDTVGVTTPQEAMERIPKDRPDLVFLDISFGEEEPVTGIDVLRRFILWCHR